MIHMFAFWTVALACIGYGLVRGGAPERAAAMIIIAGLALTLSLARTYAQRFHSPEVGVLIADSAMFTGFAVLALFANRYWPLWMTGLQGVSVMIHAAMAGVPDIFPSAYAFGLAILSYPMLLLLSIGAQRHRNRLVLHGADKSWSSFSKAGRPARPRSPRN